MNMSYCRFSNTLVDLEDCCGALEEGAAISWEEMRKAERMREMCERYIEAFDQYVESEDEEEF